MRPAEEIYEVAKSLPETAVAEVLDFAHFLKDRLEQRGGDDYDRWFQQEVSRGQADARAGKLIAATDVDGEFDREERHPPARG